MNLSLFGTYEKAISAAQIMVVVLQTRPGPGQVIFRILSGSNLLGGVWLQKLWVAGKTLEQFAEDFVNANYPGTEWELDVQIDGITAGDHNKALQFADVALTFLSQEPKAVEIQKKYSELKELGVKARHRIDEELDKLVRLKA